MLRLFVLRLDDQTIISKRHTYTNVSCILRNLFLFSQNAFKLLIFPFHQLPIAEPQRGQVDTANNNRYWQLGQNCKRGGWLRSVFRSNMAL